MSSGPDGATTTFSTKLGAAILMFVLGLFSLLTYRSSLLLIPDPQSSSESSERNTGDQFECAPWLNRSQRRIVMAHHQFRTWEQYQNGIGYNGGEAYWSASLYYVLQKLDFTVEVHGYMQEWLSSKRNVNDLLTGNVYRLITNALDFDFPVFDDAKAKCRVRSFWGIGADWSGELYPQALQNKGVYNETGIHKWDLRTVLTLWPGQFNTPINSFAHSQVTLPRSTEKYRGLKGFVISKNCMLGEFIHHLLIAGFEIHTTCLGRNESLAGLVDHGKLRPLEFALLLRKVSFVINPPYGALDNTSPLEALANGAAFIHPVKMRQAKSLFQGKKIFSVNGPNNAFTTLGMPFVYNVDFDNVTDLITAAQRASENRFPSFIPFWNRLESVMSQVCSNLIESDAICSCSEAVQGDRSIDCRGSFYSSTAGLIWKQGNLLTPHVT